MLCIVFVGEMRVFQSVVSFALDVYRLLVFVPVKGKVMGLVNFIFYDLLNYQVMPTNVCVWRVSEITHVP